MGYSKGPNGSTHRRFTGGIASSKRSEDSEISRLHMILPQVQQYAFSHPPPGAGAGALRDGLVDIRAVVEKAASR